MQLASIETVVSLSPIAGADMIELAKVLGWQTIVKKGQFKEGDRAVFIPIDTILPDADWCAFLKKGDAPIRLKTIKMKGQYSQGLLMPLSILPEHAQSWQIGADVGGLIGVKKYEKEIPACLSGEVKGNFPAHLAPKTDEDNGLSNPDVVMETIQHPFIATLKLDGSSCTIIVDNGKIEHVCSRNLSLKESDRNGFWIAAKKLNIEDRFPANGGRLIIQGELMGPGIQGNQLGLQEPTLYVYQIKNSYGWLYYDEMCKVTSTLGARVVTKVGEFEAVDCDVSKAIQKLQDAADKMVLPNGKPAEGLVFRPQKPIAMGIGRPLGFKIINRNYKDT